MGFLILMIFCIICLVGIIAIDFIKYGNEE